MILKIKDKKVEVKGMKAENQLQYLMDFYGDLFYSRELCLDHLFCVIGNGFEWRDGELVDLDEDERIERYELKEDIKHAEPTSSVREIGLMKETMLKYRTKNKEEKEDKWYPISEEYSYICNYPRDIKEDWLALIEECKGYLERDGIKVPENRGYSYEHE